MTAQGWITGADLEPGDTFVTRYAGALHTVVENREPYHGLAAAYGFRAIVVDTETPTGPNPCHRHTLTLPPSVQVLRLTFT
jgi:hypothetical protein